MNMTAAIQYILTAAQSLGSQVYYKKSRYLDLLVYYSAKTSRHRQNGLSYVLKKILTWMLREASGGLKATVDNRVKPDYHFIRKVFCYFLFLSARFLCSLASYALRWISCHRRNYSQPYFFKRNQSSDTCSHDFGAKFLL